ncbi:MAG: HAD family phosphatase [Lewinella sp.]|nr:HAD family phosphatase [Lewinella sp.]
MPLPQPPAAIIFDLDGTLVNTEPVHFRAWMEVLGKRGYHYDEHWFEQFIGKSDRKLAESVIAEHGLALAPRILQDEKQLIFHDWVVREAETFPGVAEALDRWHHHIPMAIATNSGRRDAECVFVPTQLDRYMGAVVTADDVQPNLKPAPDMYLLAAERLGVAPEHCIVIEDSPSGALAGQRAGMYVVGLTSSQPAEKMASAHELHPDTQTALARVNELLRF